MSRRLVPAASQVSPRSTVIYQEFVGLDRRGARTFEGVIIIGSTAHLVTIKCVAGDNADEFTLTVVLQDIVDAEPGFLSHLFVVCDRNEVVLVSGRYLCTLRGLIRIPNALTRFPTWKVFRRCMELLRKLHRSRYVHNSLELDSYVVVDTGSELDLQLSDFWRARPSGSGEYSTLAGVNSDLVRLGFAFTEFLDLVRDNEPDHVDDRFPLLVDMAECIVRSGRQGRGNLDLLMTHPAIKSYDRLLALAGAVSDLITDRAMPGRLGRDLLVALDEASGDNFVAWDEDFPSDVEDIDGDFRDQARAPLLWNLLDRHDSLQNVLRVFRNRSAHRIPDFARALGEIPTGFTQSWVRILPQMWILLWEVISRRQFRSLFHDYLHES
jgi:hypothetical protein